MADNNFSKTILTQTLDLNLSKSEVKNHNLTTLCTDLFLIIIKMRDAEDLGQTAALRKLIMYYLTQFEKNCIIAGFAPETVASVKYALVAILDETVLSVPGEARDFWIINPMQLEIYGDSIAGEEFYHKLYRLLENPNQNSDALEVFYLCLSLGFKGKYLLEDPGQRETIISELARAIVKTGKNIEILSPHALRLTLAKKTLGVKGAALVPLWITGSIMAAMIVILWTTLKIIGDLKIDSILNF